MEFSKPTLPKHLGEYIKEMIEDGHTASYFWYKYHNNLLSTKVDEEMAYHHLATPDNINLAFLFKDCDIQQQTFIVPFFLDDANKMEILVESDDDYKAVFLKNYNFLKNLSEIDVKYLFTSNELKVLNPGLINMAYTKERFFELYGEP